MPPSNVTQKLLRSHLAEGTLDPGTEIALRMDQTLTQDATGTLVMLALEALALDRVKTELSAQYVDHNLIQEDHKNPDDHLFLQSACRRFGVWFSRPGNGVSHPVHMERLGRPGASLLGSDSHTCAAGSLGMLAIGAGGLDVALAMAGQPFRLTMPKIWGVHVTGELPPWVSAKDVILEMLRRHGVAGGLGYIFEYFGPGLDHLEPMDRHVIANMGAELGATTTVFPSDERVRQFLASQGREQAWMELSADQGASYHRVDELDLSRLEPLIAKPSSPGNVVPVRDVQGQPIYQAYLGSSANPSYRDFAIAAHMVRGRRVSDDVSFDINPTSRALLADLMHEGLLSDLIDAGARLHQAGCNGCIGMGQAPATGRNSLRTVPRNFPGRSGTREDRVFLCSPETATASALKGCITDPRDLDIEYPEIYPPKHPTVYRHLLVEPPPPSVSHSVSLIKGPNIDSFPDSDPISENVRLPVLLKVGDDLSTDEILPAGARVLPYRSNIPRISKFCFETVDPSYVERAQRTRHLHAIVGGSNYGQGSSREHAALAPRYLGLQLVIAKSFARIHRQNLINFGILPLTFIDPEDYTTLDQDDCLRLENVRQKLKEGDTLTLTVEGKGDIGTRHNLLNYERDLLLCGGVIRWARQRAGGPNLLRQ